MSPRRKTLDITVAVEVSEETYRAHSRLHAVRVFRSVNAKPPLPVIIFLHSGDFVSGDVVSAAEMAATLAVRLHALVATPAYTLAAEKPFPEAAEDAYAALRWARAHASREGADPHRIVIAGEEAGGNLAAVAALMAKDRGGPRLVAQVLISPMLDPALCARSRIDATENPTLHSVAQCMAAYRRYLPGTFDRLHPYAAPAQCSRLTGVAPALIITAEGDPLSAEAQNYGVLLIANGVTTEVVRVPHITAETHRGSDAATNAMVNFLGPRLKRLTRSSSITE